LQQRYIKIEISFDNAAVTTAEPAGGQDELIFACRPVILAGEQVWFISQNAEKPADGRKKENKNRPL